MPKDVQGWVLKSFASPRESYQHLCVVSIVANDDGEKLLDL